MIVAMGPAVAGGGSAAGLMGGAGGYQPYNGSRTDSYGNPIPSDAGGSGIYAGKACGYGDDLCAGLAKAGDMVGQAVDGAVQNVKDTIMIMSLPSQMLLWTMMNSEGGDEVAKGAGNYRPDRALPRDKYGNPTPDADVPHTQLGTRSGRNGDYTQGREWGYDANGKLVPKRDIDFTDHGRPQNHPNPHQHDWVPNPTGGTPQHGPTKPLEWP